MLRRSLIPSLAVILVCCVSLSCAGAAAQPDKADWAVLQKHAVPEWFKDAKFGIYAHWGVYSVPAFGSEWYPRNMYIENHRVHEHHVETYGGPAAFGYKDFVPLFKAERFDAEEWADLYQRAGARFAGPVAEHHDGFSMWESDVNRWNSADMGPERDVTGELVEALRKRGVKIVTSFHHAFNIQGYYTSREGWDTADPGYGDLYGKFEDPNDAHDRWFEKIREVIDAYQPDQIWFDFGLARIPERYKRRMADYYYGKEAEWGKDVIITRKGDHLPDGVGVLDIERGKMARPADRLWQTDDSVAVNSWCWVEDLDLKPAVELVHELIDIVSKNGVLLLNVCPRADGTIPEEQRSLLLEIGAWLGVNGEGIYGTRPWLVHGDGPMLFDMGRGFHRVQIAFGGRDIRYTRKGGVLYAIALGWPEGELCLESVKVDGAGPGAVVALLGSGEKVRYEVDESGRMTITVPELGAEQRPCRYAFTFKLEGFELSLHPDARFTHGQGVTLAANEAVLDGDRIALETKAGDRRNIGFWDDAKETVHWLVRIPEAGTYTVRGEFAAAAGPIRLEIEVAGKEAAFDVPATGGWDRPVWVGAGTLAFERKGVFHLVLRPADPASWKAVNVWQLQMALDQ
jgi:alpha-L-fucosidase